MGTKSFSAKENSLNIIAKPARQCKGEFSGIEAPIAAMPRMSEQDARAARAYRNGPGFQDGPRKAERWRFRRTVVPSEFPCAGVPPATSLPDGRARTFPFAVRHESVTIGRPAFGRVPLVP